MKFKQPINVDSDFGIAKPLSTTENKDILLCITLLKLIKHSAKQP